MFGFVLPGILTDRSSKVRINFYFHIFINTLLGRIGILNHKLKRAFNSQPIAFSFLRIINLIDFVQFYYIKTVKAGARKYKNLLLDQPRFFQIVKSRHVFKSIAVKNLSPKSR